MFVFIFYGNKSFIKIYLQKTAVASFRLSKFVNVEVFLISFPETVRSFKDFEVFLMGPSALKCEIHEESCKQLVNLG